MVLRVMGDSGHGITPGTAIAVRQATTIAVPRGEPITQAAARYFQFKCKRLTAASQRSYRAALRDFAKFHADKVVPDFEPPQGAFLIEDFLFDRYGSLSGRTYNRGLSVISDLMHWLYARGFLQRDPSLTLERAKERQFHRTTFTDEQRSALLAANPYPREQIALRLLLDYGLRKGALRNVQLQHFDRDKRRLTIFTKGEKVFTLPIPDEAVWTNLVLLDGQPYHFLLPKTTTRRRTPPTRKHLTRARAALAEAHTHANLAADDDHCARELTSLSSAIELAADLLGLAVTAASTRSRLEPELQMGDHGCHLWWYRCLTRAGIVAPGTTRGHRMHGARHTAIQRVLEVTGNLKAAQALACHANISVTETYTAWSERQLDETLRNVIPGISR